MSIRLKDLDLESNPAKLRVRGEFTKTKVNRYIFITKELKEQLIKWLDFKYRTRRICYKDSKTGKTVTEYRTPEKNPNEQIFSLYQVDNPRPESLYSNLSANFAKTLDGIGMGSREDGNENRREITLHSFRRFFVKSTISDLGYARLFRVVLLDILALLIGGKRIVKKQSYLLKSTGLGISEFFLRYMAWLCLRNNEYQNSQMVIVTGPNIDLAIKLIRRMKRLFEPLNIYFDSKETVLELNRVRIESLSK